MNFWDSDSFWEGDHVDANSLTKTLSCLVHDDANLPKEVRSRLHTRALYVLNNFEFDHMLKESEIASSRRFVYYADGEIQYDDDTYMTAAFNNATEWRALKLLVKNLIDLEDFVRESAPLLELNDDQLRMLVDSFIYIEYVKRMKETDLPSGTSKSETSKSLSMLHKILNSVNVGRSSKIQVKSKCTCPGVPKELEVGSDCNICKAHEDDDEDDIDIKMTYSEVCKHYFHRACLIKHLQVEGEKTCPTCRGLFLPLAEFPEWIHDMKKVKACFDSDAHERGGPFFISLSNMMHILNAITVRFLQIFNYRDGARRVFRNIAKRLLRRIGDELGREEIEEDVDESQESSSSSSSSVECHLRSGIMKILKESKKSLDDDSFTESFITHFIPSLFQKFGLDCTRIESFGRNLKDSPPGSDFRKRVQSCLAVCELYCTLRGVAYVNLCRQPSTADS